VSRKQVCSLLYCTYIVLRFTKRSTRSEMITSRQAGTLASFHYQLARTMQEKAFVVVGLCLYRLCLLFFLSLWPTFTKIHGILWVSFALFLKPNSTNVSLLSHRITHQASHTPSLARPFCFDFAWHFDASGKKCKVDHDLAREVVSPTKMLPPMLDLRS